MTGNIKINIIELIINSLETFDSDKEENNYMKDSENVLLNNKNNINNDNEQIFFF